MWSRGGAGQERARSHWTNHLIAAKGVDACPSRSIVKTSICIFMTDDSKNPLFLIAVKRVCMCERESVPNADLIFFLIITTKLAAWLLVSIQIPMLSGGVLSLLQQVT